VFEPGEVAANREEGKGEYQSRGKQKPEKGQQRGAPEIAVTGPGGQINGRFPVGNFSKQGLLYWNHLSEAPVALPS
jgi:hypothetical protein